jgi:dATP pyrophosphohydrolase
MPARPHRFRRPESVLVVVCTRDGQALVLERADRPGCWQSVTGSLEWDESAEAAASRELVEETGIRDRPDATGITRRFRIAGHWRERYEPGIHWNLEYEFRLMLDQPVAVTLSQHEHLQFQWLPLMEAADRVFSWTNREALENMAAELAQGARRNPGEGR